eukprot:4731419-Ditylum_brightwellii.AAC.1
MSDQDHTANSCQQQQDRETSIAVSPPPCQYMGTAELVIMTYQSSLDNLPEKLGELGFNINMFCYYVSEMLKTLCDTGDDDTQTSLKFYKALALTKFDTSSSEIRTYKAAVATKDRPLDFIKLTTIAHTKYTSLVMHS